LEIPTGSTVKVMTYNIHFGQNNKGIYDIEGIKNVIKNQKPNIVGFQEVTYLSPFNGYTTMFIELTAMMKSLGFDYYYTSEGYNYNLGNTIFSQFEIKSAETIQFNDWNAWQRSFVEAKIDVNGNDVIVISTHLTHIPGATGEGKNRISEVNQLLRSVSKYSLNTQNVVVLGDFNIVPANEENVPIQEYVLLTSVLNDSWIDRSNVNPTSDGFTAPADNPKRRIDYIFRSAATSVMNCEVYDTQASDHLPLTCEFDFS
ncbi:MAG: endonuclease/exonuclease/phosphatase family protein, partial [Candidatus Kariarchaeaceae archaeon]